MRTEEGEAETEDIILTSVLACSYIREDFLAVVIDVVIDIYILKTS